MSEYEPNWNSGKKKKDSHYSISNNKKPISKLPINFSKEEEIKESIIIGTLKNRQIRGDSITPENTKELENFAGKLAKKIANDPQLLSKSESNPRLALEEAHKRLIEEEKTRLEIIEKMKQASESAKNLRKVEKARTTMIYGDLKPVFTKSTKKKRRGRKK